MTNIKTENEILESQELRNELLSRTEVLDKVKTLFLLPKLEMMTRQQVADYYDVDTTVIEKCYQRNEAEIREDGVVKESVRDIADLLRRQNVCARNYRGYKEFDIAEGVTMRLPNSGSVLMFSKRAILRIGMLLRDSEIAKEVRTQLLNTFEEATPEQRTVQMTTEQELTMKVLDTIDVEDPASFEAFVTYRKFMNRHVMELQKENEEIKTDNQMLAGEILKWNDRNQVNRIVRYLSHALDIKWQFIWTDLYNELLYKHGINLKIRQAKSNKKNATKLDMVRDSEWPALQASLAAICESYGFSPEKVYQKALKYQSQ